MKLFTTCSVVLTLAFGIVADANAGPILWASTGNTNDNGGGRIYTIDVDSGIVTLVGNSGLNKLGALDFDSNGVLYGIANGSRGVPDPDDSDFNLPVLLYTFTFSKGEANREPPKSILAWLD